MGNQNSITSHVNSEKISFFHYINVNPDSPDLRDKWFNLSAPPELENNCQLEGIFSPVAGIMGSLQANEVLKTILNLRDDLNSKILVFDSLKMNLRKIKISFNSKCLNKCGL